MKKFALKTTVAAAGLLVSSLGMAAVDMDAPVSGTNGGVYASEIVLATPSQALAKGAAADQVANVTLGASFAVDKQAYVRFDLDGGTFVAAPSFAIDGNDGAGGGTAADTTVSQGGQVGDSYVIFAVNPKTGEFLDASEAGTLTGAGIAVTNKNGVKIAYRLYETLTSAVNQTPNTALKEKTGIEFITFAPALAVTATVNETATAEVSDAAGPYFKFTGGNTTAGIGKVAITHTAKALISGAASTVGDILDATNAITITGDFTWASGVTIDGSNATIAADKQSATLSNIAAATLVDGSNLDFVVTATGAAAIPVGNYTSQVEFAPKANFAVSDVAGGTGEIKRNGTTLKFPALSVGKGNTTWLQLVNSSNLNAPVAATCYLDNGTSVAGAAGIEVAANTTLRKTLEQVCPTSTNKVQSAILTLAVPAGSVNGTVMRKGYEGVMSYANASAGNQ